MAVLRRLPSPASAACLLLLALALVWVPRQLVHHPDSDVVAYDFHGTLWQPGQAILHGRSPYDLARLEAWARTADPSGPAIDFAIAVYPAPALVAALPLALLPYRAAAGVYAVLLLAGLVGALLALGVRDWRCHAVALASAPLSQAIHAGGLTPLLLLGVALAWRYRDRRWPPAAAVAAVVVAKLFLWPLLVFFLVTRRAGVAMHAVALAAAAVVVGWAPLGFSGLVDYPRLARALSTIELGHDRSLATALITVGVPAGLARPAVTVLTVLGLALVAWLARRPDGDRRAFSAAVAVGVLACPVSWTHTFLLILVPVALASPRLSALWAATLAFWAALLVSLTAGGIVLNVVALAVVAAALRRRPRPEPATGPQRPLGARPALR